MDLVVHRDHDGNHRMLLFRKYQLSVGQVLVPNLKVSLNAVLPLVCGVQFQAGGRVKHRIFHIAQLLSLYRTFRNRSVKGLSCLSSGLENQGLVAV